MNLSGKTVLVTGHAGFLGQHLCRVLDKRGALVQGCLSSEYDLRKLGHVHGLMNKIKPDLVIHAAARVGGILFNKSNPYTIGRDNLLMGLNIIDACILNRTPKLVMVSSCCAYPAFPDSWPFDEESLWSGAPEPSNAAYGIAKRTLGTITSAAVEEKRLPCAATVLLANLYGPDDNFHPENSHVIPAMIRKLCDAADRNLPEVEFWGSGNVSRDFLYVTDAAEGIARVCEGWDLPTPLNLGSGKEVFLRDLAVTLAGIIGFKGNILWNNNGLDGQRSRCLDVRKAAAALGWWTEVGFEEGLRQTVEWWREQKSREPSCDSIRLSEQS